MNQERLSDLAIISVETQVMENLEFENVFLTDFPFEKAREIHFIWYILYIVVTMFNT